MNHSRIADTFTECFNLWYSRVLITAIDSELAMVAANNTIGFGTSIIMCPAEVGIEKTVDSSQTPDDRPGVIIQIWTRRSKTMREQLLERLSQCAMTAPTTTVFNLLEEGEKSEPIGKLIAYFGDGYQKQLDIFGRKMWEIPVMDGSFLIEDSFNMTKGIAGGVLILVGSSEAETLAATKEAVKAVHQLGKVITPFPGGICRSGSKIGSKYSFLNVSTNHKFCPTIRDKVSDSLLPEGANCAYEIVINARNEEELKEALREAINAVKDDERIVRITSANYEGELGAIKINLKDL